MKHKYVVSNSPVGMPLIVIPEKRSILPTGVFSEKATKTFNYSTILRFQILEERYVIQYVSSLPPNFKQVEA